MLVGCAHARLFLGEPVAARRHFEELVSVARRRADVGALATGLVGLGAAALAEGDCDRAGEHLREGTAVASAAADAHTEVIGRIWLAELARVAGHADEARRQLDACAARARPMGSPYPLALSLLALGRASLDDGQLDAARRHLDEAVAVAGHARLGHIEAAALDSLGEVFVSLGNGAAAQGLFQKAAAVAEKGGEKIVGARATYHLAEQARARGDLEHAATLHHDALLRLHVVGARPPVADSLDALGGLAVERDNLAYAARVLGAAAGLRAAGGWAPPVHRQDRYASDVARLRARMAPSELQAAWETGAALGSADAVAYASRGRGRRARSGEGRDSLTPAERHVVALAVEGLTAEEIGGRLFISARTVHSHLHRAYAKLGVSSRRELRRWAAGARISS